MHGVEVWAGLGEGVVVCVCWLVVGNIFVHENIIGVLFGKT